MFWNESVDLLEVVNYYEKISVKALRTGIGKPPFRQRLQSYNLFQWKMVISSVNESWNVHSTNTMYKGKLIKSQKMTLKLNM